MDAIANWIQQLKEMDLAQIQATLESYSSWGPLPGLLMPFIEAFLPFLPLIVIIAANVNIYGLGLGFVLSWIGVFTGAISVFFICRLVGGKLRIWLDRRYPKSNRFFDWIEKRGFTPLFLLACFPFTPSVLVTVASGLSRVHVHTFVIATILGKGVMIFAISLLSFDITNLLQEPWRIAITILVVAVLWLGGKKLESHYQLTGK